MKIKVLSNSIKFKFYHRFGREKIEFSKKIVKEIISGTMKFLCSFLTT